MKANELMIGDWVTIKDEKRHRKVTQLCVTQYMEGGEWDEELCVDDFCEQFSNVEPIPLTNDILNKNGFEEFGTFGMCRLKVESEQKTICANGTYIEVYSNSNHESMLRLHSTHFTVHELQHALRLCGLNDLADNFKLS